MVAGNDGKLYGGTADGGFDLAAGNYSSAVVAISRQTMSIVDHFVPANWKYLTRKDLDMASANVAWFEWDHRKLIAQGSKEGVVYLLDAESMGGKDHQTPLYTSPRLGNDKEACCDGIGIWGGLTAARDSEGQTWVYVPMGGPMGAKAVFPGYQRAEPARQHHGFPRGGRSGDEESDAQARLGFG